MIEQYTEWLNHVKSDLERSFAIFAIQLSDEPEQLIKDITKIEAWGGRIGELLAEANGWVDRASLYYLPSKEGKTEFDRKIILENAVAPMRTVRDKIESVADCIKTRITLGQSILRYKTMFVERSNFSAQKQYSQEKIF